MSRMKTKLEIVGECAGCYDSIYENEQFYKIETKYGPALVHSVTSCCVDFVSENATIHYGMPKRNHSSKITSIFSHSKFKSNFIKGKSIKDL